MRAFRSSSNFANSRLSAITILILMTSKIIRPRNKVARIIPMIEYAATFTGGQVASAMRIFVSKASSSSYVNLYSQTVLSSYLIRAIH